MNPITHPPAEQASTEPEAELGHRQGGQDHNHRGPLSLKAFAGAGIDGNSEASDMGGQSSGGKSRPEVLHFPRITCAELDATEYRIEYLIDSTLVAGQPCVIAGGKKSLKTSLVIDMGISLATGGFFLGVLKVNRPCRVGIMSGESGMAIIQETARRIANAAGYRLRDIDGLVFSEHLPQFENRRHAMALRRFIMDNELEVLFVDPAYLCMSGTDAGNLFVQGEKLRPINAICSETGCTFGLVHHCRKGGRANSFDPPELQDIAWSGFQEWARQWILVGRRERYEPGSGDHRLWLNVGGSAGHSSLWALDVSEGVFDSRTPRKWDVRVWQPEDARRESKAAQGRRRQEKLDTRLQDSRRTILRTMASPEFTAGETKEQIKTASRLHPRDFRSALASLIDDGSIVAAEIRKGRRVYDGYKLSEDQSANE